MNPGHGPGHAAQSGRPGQMTAVMRAMQQSTGPKVLRIGLVASGRILEERIVKQRTSVTVGPSEKSMFVVQANVPPQFKLFELIGNDYYLNFLDGMTGRVALATGITDLIALKGQAKRVGPAYQIRLTEEARGKVVIGETTFLFQFVAPPPVQPRPQLPLSVKGGVASQIDWNLTIIAAFSFLMHFGLIGAMYSDWMDPVVSDDLTAALTHMVQEPPTPPPVETAEASASATSTEATPSATAKASATPKQATPSAPAPTAVQALLQQAEQARIAILASLAGGQNIQGAMKDDNGAPVDLNSLATREGGIANANGGLNLPGGAGGPIKPGS
ncbi:MAG TPA: energy transducer TonB, partial [Polyangiaceae bacterium]|nr:energy transducer TonB [Polyangiaceae bacterium]